MTVLILFFLLKNMWSSHKVVFGDESIWDYEDKGRYAEENPAYEMLESEFMNQYSYPTDAIFAGDSIIYRCQWNEIFPEFEVKNRGIPSDTTEGLFLRVDSILKTQPKKVFIMIGINDISSGVNEEEILINYNNIVDTLSEAADIEIYVQSILPVAENHSIWKKKIVDINGRIEEMCYKKGIEYIDLYSVFVDDSGYLAEQYSMDGVHINARGYECWKNKIMDYIY